MNVYISGKITGDTNYVKKFAEAEFDLRTRGYNVINPCDLCYPFLSYEQFMHIDFALIDVSDAVYMLKDWEESVGAMREKVYAESKGKDIMYENNTADDNSKQLVFF